MKRWLHNLKVSQKLALIGIFFMLPDSVMLYMVVTQMNENIQFAVLEQKGNEYQRPLEDLLKYLPEHGFLAGRVIKGDKIRESLVEKQAQIERVFNALEGIDARIGAELQFTDEGLAKRNRQHYRVHNVRKEWDDLIRQLPQLDAEACANSHAHLVSDVRTMITHAGDQSNLILDPDLDSYYLMDVTLLSLPATQDRLATVMDFGGTALKQKRLTSGERMQFSIYATLLKEDRDRILKSSETAMNEDKNFYQTSPTLQASLSAGIKDYETAAGMFNDMTMWLANSDKATVTVEQYLAAGQKARAASFKLWDAAVRELDVLLQRRIAHFKFRRTLCLGLTALAVVAAFGLVTFITRSISGPLQRQAEELTTVNKAFQKEIGERQRFEIKLAEQARELNRSNAELAQFAYVASHDLQEPLRMVSNYCQMLKRRYAGKLDQDANEFIGFAVDGAVRMQKLIEGLLKYSRVGTHGGELTTVNCEEVLRGALANLQGALADSGAKVTNDPLPTITADGDQLTQVLQNLIGNALKFRGKEAPHVHVSAKRQDVDWLFSVRDNGIGIDPQHAERIFVIFQRLHTQKEYPGTGIGLSICRKIAERHGGKLWVESKAGAGATFYFTLPAKTS